jgi:hypothetical protein
MPPGDLFRFLPVTRGRSIEVHQISDEEVDIVFFFALSDHIGVHGCLDLQDNISFCSPVVRAIQQTVFFDTESCPGLSRLPSAVVCSTLHQ